MFIPAIQRAFLSGRPRSQQEQTKFSFPKTKNHDYSGIKLFDKGMVLIMFKHVSTGKSFRYRNDWWTKSTWSGGEDSMLDFSEIESDVIVGVFLKDLTSWAKEYIIKRY